MEIVQRNPQHRGSVLDLINMQTGLNVLSSLRGSRNKSLTPRTSLIADDRLRVAVDRFYAFRDKLKRLDNALRAHLENLKRTAATKAAVVSALSDTARDTPMSDPVGAIGGGTAQDQGGREHSSYAGLHAASSTQSSVQLDRYADDITSYVTEWEKTVATRVATELKLVQNLHKTWDRYHQKVEALKAAAQKKKGGARETDLEKISWNESKLRTAKKEYRRNLVAVTLLTEEVADRGWKDLIPLMVRLIDFDVDNATSGADLMSRLADVRRQIIELGSQSEMDYEAMRAGRLRILLEEDTKDFVDPEELLELESTVLSVNTKGGRSVGSPTGTLSPTGSAEQGRSHDGHDVMDKEDSPRGVDEEEHTQSPGENKREDEDFPIKVTREQEIEHMYEDSSAMPNYPTSIYLNNHHEGGVDDQSTITGMPDMVSI